MVHVENVTFFYNKTKIFENLDYHIDKGESWAILGPSGCGKSTLLALLAGLILPTNGKISIDGLDLKRPRPQTGLILQDFGLLPWATVRENAELGFELRKFYGADGIHSPNKVQNSNTIDFWLKRLGLENVSNNYPSQLSGGQRQRTAIARTLSLNPDLLLMDEPFSSLDAPTREALQKLTLEFVKEKNLTLIMVTHSIEEAVIIGNKILLLDYPPNKNTRIIENRIAGNMANRDSKEYHLLCKELRLLMENSIR